MKITIPKQDTQKIKIKKKAISKSFCILGGDSLEIKKRRRIFWRNFYACKKCKVRYCKEHFYKWAETSDKCFACEQPIKKLARRKKVQDTPKPNETEKKIDVIDEESDSNEDDWHVEVFGPSDPVIRSESIVEPEVLEVIDVDEETPRIIEVLDIIDTSQESCRNCNLSFEFGEFIECPNCDARFCTRCGLEYDNCQICGATLIAL